MRTLSFSTLELDSAWLGPPNPLPPLWPPASPMAAVEVQPSVPEEARARLGYGCDAPLLPYGLLDDYDRERRPRPHRVAVLESEHLRAEVLIGLGGRLWSLLDKTAGRELLYRNAVLQPCNLATRNAWFAGGVEWNVSLPGHSPHTCEPLHAAAVDGQDGPILRLWAFERVRGVPWQLDLWIPEGSRFLYAAVRIQNPHDVEIPMYWWTNIAVPQAPDVRTLAPALHAYNFGYAQRMERVPVPVVGEIDATYATRLAEASDWFYELPPGQRPWIAALSGEGRGLVHASTARLGGRKMFAWGTSTGGQQWQSLLSPAGGSYFEIQAGLSRTQYECVPMPAGAEWAWVEALGPLSADPRVVHGRDWGEATSAVEAALEAALPTATLEAALVAVPFDEPPGEVAQRGAGWGALEALRRTASGEAPLAGSGMPFPPEALGPAQAPWRALLEDGELPARDPRDEPGDGPLDLTWRQRLETAIARGRGGGWLGQYWLGLSAWYAGDGEEAARAWERSLAIEPSPWALRNLAWVLRRSGDAERAVDLYDEARRLEPDLVPLLVEWADTLLAAGRARELVERAGELPGHAQAHGRIRLLVARAAIACGELELAEGILAGPLVVPDLREGDLVLSEAWARLWAERIAHAENVPVDDALLARARAEHPPPPHLDFRMAG